jgi:curli biogenesis system outer membrane secretion channel CsgG
MRETPFRSLTVACALVLGVLLIAPQLASAQGYIAFAVTKDGEFPIPEDFDDIDDKHLIAMEWGPYAGPTRRVAVMPVDNTSSGASWSMPGWGSYEWGSTTVPVNGIEAMITDCMQRSGRFRLVERTEVGNVLAEQDLAAAGRTTQQSGARTGQILGAEYMVQAVITSYEPDFKGKGGGLGGIASGVLGGAKVGKSQSMVGMNFRLVNAETSEIVFTKQVDVIVSDSQFALGGVGWGSAGALGGFVESYSKTPIGQAVMSGVNQGVLELVKQIGTAPMEGSVVQVKDNQIYINLGADAVAQGDIFQAMKPGEELIDPDTGMSLGGEATPLGQVQIATVNDKFSIGLAVDFDPTQLERGDILVSTQPPPPLNFAPTWTGPQSKEQKKKGKG